MYRPRDIWRLLSLVALLGVLACSDLPTAQERVIETGEPAAFFLTAPGPGIVALRSHHPLKGAVTVTKSIGPKGGVIKIKKLGVRIYFPKRALSEKTEITVKALGGSVVGFEFGPHGLTFDAPVEIRIDRDSPLLADLDLGDDDGDGSAYTLSGLVGIYFLGDPLTGVIPLETLPMYVDGDVVVLEISHFSGYAIASG